MPSPEVVDGMRQPRAVRLEDIRRSTEAAFAPPSPTALAPEGVTVYVSASRSYLVEVLNVPSYVHEGRRYPAKRIAAQFENGVYRNNAKDPKTRALIDEALQSNKYFGRFGDSSVHFWLASDQQKTVEAAKVKSALDVLKTIPREQIDAFLAQGTAEDHEIPAPAAQPAPKPGVRPIAPAQ